MSINEKNDSQHAANPWANLLSPIMTKKTEFLNYTQQNKLEAFYFAIFLAFVFMTSFGTLIYIENIYLFGDIYIGNIGIGRQSANILYLFIPVGIFYIYQKGWPKYEFSKYEKIAFIFFIFLLFHLLWAEYPGKAKKAPRYFFLCLMCYYSTIYIINSRKKMAITLSVYISGAVIIAIVNLYHFFILKVGLISWHWSWKSFLASYMALNICLCIFLFLHSIPNWQKILFASLGILFGATLLASAARGTYLSFTLALFIVGAFYNRKIIVFTLITAILGLGLIFTVIKSWPLQKLESAFRDISSRISNTTSQTTNTSSTKIKDHALNERLEKLWPAAIDTIKKNPILGLGCNSFTKELKAHYSHKFKITPVHSDAHNSILQILFSLGVVGLGFYLTFIFYSFKLILQNIKKLQDPLYKAFNLAILTWMICHCFESMVAYYYFKHRYVMTLTLMLALVVKTKQLESNPTD